MNHKEETGKRLSHEGTISRQAFVRAWSFGTQEEQGEMLFDLLGESVIARIRNIEENQRRNDLALSRLEEQRVAMETTIHNDFRTMEKKWAYIAGGIAVVAVVAGPVLIAFLSFFKEGACP